MGKKNKGMMIIGSIMLGLVTILLVYVVLISTGVIVGREYTIKVEAISAEKEYDGTPLTLTDYRIVEGQEYLDKNGHHLEVNCSGNQTDAGTTVGHLDVSVFDSSNAEVTSRYNIVTTDATITVNPRVITFKTYGKEMAYDGSTLDVSSLSTAYEQLSGEAVVGQKLSFSVSGSQTEIGSCPVQITISAFDSEDNPISANNYVVKYEGEQAQLTVRPRYIYITKSTDYNATYDGTSKQQTGSVSVVNSRSEFINGAVVGLVTFSFNETNVGEYKIEDFNFTVTDKNGKDVSEYYAIDPDSIFPYYYINPIKGIFKTLGQTKTYDGVLLSLEEYDTNLLKLAPTDKAIINWENSIINAGEVENTATIVIQNELGIDVTSNYDFTTEYGVLKILPRPITITTYDATKPFDGTTLYGVDVKQDGKNYAITAGTLASGETIDVELKTSILEVGEVLNEITSVIIKNKDNLDVTDNYEINRNEGNLSITKIIINIITSDKDWNYDGKEHNTSDVGAQVQGLPETCSIVFTNWPTLVDATLDQETNEIYKVDNKPDYVVYDANNNVVYDSTDSKKQENLQVTSESWGKLRVMPMDLAVETKGNLDNPKTYDGSLCYNHIVTVTGLQEGHEISYEWPNDRSNVTRDEFDHIISFENKPTVIIKDSTGRVITQNYRITFVCGELKVIPADLYVTTSNVAKYYDGLPIVVKDTDYEVTGNFANGDHIANVKTVTDCINVKKVGSDIGSYDNIITFTVVDKNNQDVTDNYNIIDASIGKLTINPITIKLTTGSGAITYDGKPHTVEDNYVVTDEFGNPLPANFRCVLSNFKEFTDVNLEEKASRKENTCTASFYITIDNIEQAVNNNNVYIVEEYGEVVVYPIKVKVVVKDKEKTYDGNPFVYDANNADDWFEIVSYTNHNGENVILPTGHVVKMDETEFAKTLNSFINVKTGGYDYEVKLKVYDGTKDTVNKNYEFEYVKGSIQINKLTVVVYTESAEFTYDGLDHQFKDDYTITDEDGNPISSTLIPAFTDFRVFNNANEDGKDSDKENKCTVSFEIDNGNGKTKVKEGNFNIITHYGTVVVRKITLKVSAKDKEKQYDGLPFVYDNIPSNWFDVDGYYDNDNNPLPAPVGANIEVDVKAFNSSISSIIDVVKGGSLYVFTSKTLKITKGGSDAINNNYKVECSSGKIIINPLEIKLYTGSGEFTYDGNSHTFEDDCYITDLDGNDLPTMFSYVTSGFTNFVNVKDSEKDNKCNIKFYITIDGIKASSSSDNFNITPVYGHVTVHPISVNVTASYKEKTYDATPFVFNEGDDSDWYTITSYTKHDGTATTLVAGHNISVNVSKFNATLSFITNYKSTGNKYEIDFVVKNGSVDETDNYEFICSSGVIMINPMKLKLSTGSADFSYDGTNHTYESDAVLTMANNSPLDSKFNYTLTNFTVFKDAVSSASGNNDCKVNLTVNIGGNDVTVDTNNFEVQKNLGKVTVHPITILVSCKNQVKTFDGKPFVFTEGDDENWYIVTGYKNYFDESVSLIDDITIKMDKDTLNNAVLKTKINYSKDGYEYQVSLKAYNMDNSINKNYEFSYVKGVLTISPMTVVVTTGSYDYTYDGENHTYDSDVVVVDGNGNPLDLTVFDYDLTNFATFKDVNYEKADNQKNTCKIKFYVYQDMVKTVSKDENYDFQFNYGKVKIYPIKIYVTSKNNEKTYDAAPFVYNVGDDALWYEITSYEDKDGNEILALPDGCQVTMNTTVFNTKLNSIVKYKDGGYTYEVACKVTKGGSDSVNNNFTFIYIEGKLTIHQINVSIKAKDKTKLYDGSPFIYDPLEESTWYETPVYTDHNGNPISLPTNHNVKLNASKLQTILNGFVNYDKDGYEYTVPFDAYNGLDPSVNENYKFTYQKGKITINRIAITVYTTKTYYAGGTYEETYSGNPIIDNEIYITPLDTIKLTNVGVTNTPEVKSATSFSNVQYNDKGIAVAVDNEIEIAIKVDGVDITDNFDITYNTGKLKINPVTVQISSETPDPIIYDGLPHEFNTLTITNLSELSAFTDEIDGKSYTFDFINKSFNQFTNCKYNEKNEVTYYENNGTFTFVVKNRNDEVVTSNFIYVFTPGKVTIKRRSVNIILSGAEKEFDGSPLTQTVWTYSSSLDEIFLNDLSHTLEVTATGSQTNVGESNNTFSYVVKDSENNDVSKNYIISNISEGILKVKKLELTMISNSKSKVYDGTELTCHEILNVDELADQFAALDALGYTIQYTYYGTQTEVGSSKNTFTAVIKDSSSNTLSSSNYVITYNYGFLEVLPYVTGTGNLAKQTAEADNTVTSFVLNSTNKGIIYLRDRSYGDYTGTGWDYIPDYDSDMYNANSILAKVLDDNGYISHGSLTITSNDNMPYLVPYYGYSFDLFNNLNGGDTHVSKSHGDTPYTVDYYIYRYNLINLSLSDVNYIDFEDDYYDYVNSVSTYLKIDSTMRTKLIALATEKGISITDPDLILEINELIHDNFIYEYDPGRRNTDDIVNYFLFGSNKKGTCQDFASAATLMYRAFGIPARYTTGFVCEVNDDNVGTDINVTQNYAHAWVEIYIKGMGWINVEVTNGMPLTISDGGATSDVVAGTSKAGMLNSSDFPMPTGATVFTINSDRSGSFYLRGYSMGNYNGSGFDEVVSPYVDSDYNPLTYESIIFENKGYNHSYMTIDLTSHNYNGYLTPYFTSGDYTTNDATYSNDDTYLDGNYASKYIVDYVYVNLDNLNLNWGSYPTATSAISSEELAYRTYVYNNYLSMNGASTELLNAFSNLVATKGWNKSNTTIINDVRNYIVSTITYQYAMDYVSSSDMVYDILFVDQVGVCQHFAAAATMLYRYLGIPARWVSGYYATVSVSNIGKDVDVTNKDAHSWVEVYLDGFGWCPVEVTFGSNSQGDIASGFTSESGNIFDGTESDAIKVMLYPKEMHIPYANIGDPIDLNNIVGLSPKLISEGYYVVGTVEAETLSLGQNVTKIKSYAIYDKDDKDVTNKFEVSLRDGIVQVYLDKITITTKSATKPYDGTSLVKHEVASITGSTISGHTLNTGNIIYTGEATTPGINVANTIMYSNLITDNGTGNDVTNKYWIVVQTGQLSIVKRDVTLTADTLELTTSEYDELGGGDIVCHEYTIDGLAAGHYIYDITWSADSYISDSQDYADNVIESVTIYDESDNDVTNCYNVIFEDGELWLY